MRLREEITQINNRLCRHEIEAESGGRNLGDPLFDKSLTESVEEQGREGGCEPDKRVHRNCGLWIVDPVCLVNVWVGSDALFPLTPALFLSERELRSAALAEEH